MRDTIQCPKCGYDLEIMSYFDDNHTYSGTCFECDMEYEIKITDERKRE